MRVKYENLSTESLKKYLCHSYKNELLRLQIRDKVGKQNLPKIERTKTCIKKKKSGIKLLIYFLHSALACLFKVIF